MTGQWNTLLTDTILLLVLIIHWVKLVSSIPSYEVSVEDETHRKMML